jgi:tetratricopeptide (TPR) repeat protein
MNVRTDWTCAPSKNRSGSRVEGRRGRRVGGALRQAAVILAVSLPLAGCAAVGGGGWDPEAARAAAEAHELNGWRRLQKGKVASAERAFQQALQTDPTFYAAHLGLARCHYEKREADLEIAEYLKCVAMNPDCVEAWVQLGDAHWSRDALRDARQAYEQALRAGEATGYTGQTRVLHHLAVVLRDLGALDEAWAAAERLSEQLRTAPPRPDRPRADELQEWLGSQGVLRALREGAPAGAAEQ